MFIKENAFENVVWKMAAILYRPQCVKLTWSTENDGRTHEFLVNG